MADFSEAIKRAIQSELSELHTCLPGRIVSYDYTTQKASVKPLLKRVYADDGSIVPLPIINDVPVMFPRAGSASLTFPLSAGDGVLLVFSERSLDDWLSLGGDVAPTDPRKFDLGDAIAYPGFNSFKTNSLDPNGTDLTLQFAGGKVTIAPDGEVALEKGTGKIVINPDGKIAIGITEELLDLFEQTLSAIELLTIASFGTPPVNILDFTAIKAKLATIKGTL